MDNINALGELFRSFWDFFSLEHPVLGISFGKVLNGFFVVCFSVTLLRPILGIGAGAIRSVTSVGRGIRSRNESELRHQQRLDAIRNSPRIYVRNR